MKRILLLTVLLLSPLGTPAMPGKTPPDVFWLDRYGDLRWETEKIRLDNFVITLFNEPKYTGYIYIQVGRRSCRGEAIAHAVRARDYLMKVRHIPWNRVAWRDLGYGDRFEVTLWLFPSGAPPRYLPAYEAPTAGHVIDACSSPLERPKSRASNKSLHASRISELLIENLRLTKLRAAA
jgi:hypothetical protein